MQPFVVYNATNILLNADMFARMHRTWAQRAVEMAAPQAPGFVLGALQILATLDPVWAKQLATTAATTMPAAVWAHVHVLLVVDTPRAESLLWQAVSASPYVVQTIEKVPATAALVYLGNCGSYMLQETILRKAPKAHILTTKGIGIITINDPLLKALND